MIIMTTELAPANALSLTEAIAPAVSLWADHVTDATSPRRLDIIRDKSNAVLDFFSFTGKAPAQITPLDIKDWQVELEARELAPTTVYARISRISSFFNWAKENGQIQHNPVDAARPKAPKAYQTEATQALADKDVIALLKVVKAKAETGNIVGKRDYALLLFYFTTGMRRREIIQLTWGDIKINDTIILTAQVKGSEYVNREVSDKSIKTALLDYLESAGRLTEMTPESPLWTPHDRTGQHIGQPLSSHGFVKNLKRYAREAGVGPIHLHQTQHTYARIVSEDTGSLIETQEALGHKNAATTRVYVQRIGVKRDKHSERIAARLGIE